MFDPYDLPRPKRTTITRTFKEHGQEVTFTFREPSLPDVLAASEMMEKLWERHVTGTDTEEAVGLMDPSIPPSRPLFSLACVLYTLQVAGNPAERLDPLAWMVLLDRMPNTAMKLQSVIVELSERGAAQRKKSEEGTTDAFFEPPPSSPEDIPSPPYEPMPSFVRKTTVSEPF